MPYARRLFLQAVAPALLLTPTSFRSQRKTPPAPEWDELPKPKPRDILKANQKDIQRDVKRLLELAEELKKEVEKTDSTEIFSLKVVRKAEEIEKLARRIKELARA